MSRDVKGVLAELKKRGTEQTRSTYARHRLPRERTFGVSAADMKVVAKSIRGQHELALELFDTGMIEAMCVAAMVVDRGLLTKKQLDAWVTSAQDFPMLSSHTIPGVAIDHVHGRELAMKWIGSKKEGIAACGWATYARLVAARADEDLDLKEIAGLLERVAGGIHGAPNRVRSTMNGFVISVGTHVKPLLGEAKSAARRIGVVMVDMGDTACQVPVAAAAIAKVEAAGKLGKKRKA